ncbi:hypothetical protein OIU34_23280 [Pararhizobium sp. BT-229]|uniref:hypothetical protein n=1 Tax=Pararhizobium sp. BT-229 TaxID=2986923 RepID=UPI0021F7DD6F|nr:hypothetical protein [Pararhizobium sp. BT-229]MCV9964819.1 hypothetical protein [Pararhizobium sp. BT-229]
MPPIYFVFERLIGEVERRVGRAIARDEIEADPVNGPAIVGKTVNEVFGKPTTREALVIMSSIENINEYTMDTRPLEVENEISVVMKDCLAAVIDQRLLELRNGVAAISFAAGFAPVAEKLVSLAESAIETFPASKWVSGVVVAETRDALERVLDKCGSRSDLETVLRATELMRGLLMSPKDKVSWQRHGLDFETVQEATNEFKPYKEMLGLGVALADDALTAISNRAASELRPGKTHLASAPTL